MKEAAKDDFAGAQRDSMATTLEDIARALNVSKMTVSRAINDHPEISRETRARILAMAQKMNYRPNQFARALTTHRSYLIGIVVPDLMHSYFAEICRGVESHGRPAGYQNLICMATEHLIRLGHREIGHLGGTGVSTSTGRFHGYHQALTRHGLPLNDALVRECGFTEAQGYEAMKAWLKEKIVPPAVFAANDPAAIGAMTALNEAGLKVPDNVAIVGAGSIHYGDMLKVPLTTVSWSTSEMGQEAVRLLLELIESKKKKRNSQQIVVKPQLVVRQSCGATKV